MRSADAARLMDTLGLSEEELCRTLQVDPLTLLSGQLDHVAELPILLALLDDALEQTTPSLLRRWVRANGPRGKPIELLLGRDFAGFEEALRDLSDRGFVLRRSGRELGS